MTFISSYSLKILTLLKSKIMFRKIFLLIFFTTTIAKAQWYALPDTNFRNYLIFEGAETCMNATHDSIQGGCGLSSINIGQGGLNSLEGIQAFTNLNQLVIGGGNLVNLPPLPNTIADLDITGNPNIIFTTLPSNLLSFSCGGNGLSNLPPLPNSLLYLNCYGNQLTSLSNLPNTIRYIQCGFNQINNIALLPDSLRELYCGYNSLSALPNLPNNLEELNCYNNQLISIPGLPNSIANIYCHNNLINSLPLLPNSLAFLSCYNNMLSNLPQLPNSLIILYCDNNLLTALPTLPNSLSIVSCANNQLTNLPSLQNGLIELVCDYNLISNLPPLPNTLEILTCEKNLLTNVPALPNSLTYLNCSKNQISILPILPYNLHSLICNSNQLLNLPTLPNGLGNLACNHNNISGLQPLPDSIYVVEFSHNLISDVPYIRPEVYVLNCSNNPISCLPQLPATMLQINVDSTLLSCLPNYTFIPPYASGIGNIFASTNLSIYPLCTIGNASNCYVCSSQPNFTLVADTTTPHNYFAINQSTGAGNLQYVWHWGDNSVADSTANPTHIYAAPGFYNICVTVTDSSACSNTFCDSSTYISRSSNAMISVTVINATTGIHQLKNKDAVSLSPNPTSSTFHISNTQNIKNISIKNMLGREVFQTNSFNNSVVEIDASSYSAGVYFVELQFMDYTVTKKLIKN